jgi:hypothetical protein
MKINGSVALVTGANRGLGGAFENVLSVLSRLTLPGRTELLAVHAGLAAEPPVYVGTGA